MGYQNCLNKENISPSGTNAIEWKYIYTLKYHLHLLWCNTKRAAIVVFFSCKTSCSYCTFTSFCICLLFHRSHAAKAYSRVGRSSSDLAEVIYPWMFLLMNLTLLLSLDVMLVICFYIIDHIEICLRLPLQRDAHKLGLSLMQIWIITHFSGWKVIGQS